LLQNKRQEIKKRCPLTPIVCVTGKNSSPLSQKASNNRHQDQQQYIISNNRETFNTNNNGDSKSSNGTIHSTSNLNNKSDFNCVTNKIYHHHINGNSLCNNNQNSIAKSVILGFDKNTLDYKNNKNMILNRHKNNGNNTLTNNNYNQSSAYASQQIYEKHLNSVNHLKSVKHFIITNEIENFDTKKNVKFQLVKPQNGVETQQEHHHHLHTNGNGNVTKDKAPNVLEIIPTNVNIHKVNGHLNGFYMSGHNNMKNGTESTVAAAPNLKSAESHSKTRNGFVRNCSHGNNTTNGRSNECSTIKINYVSRQTRGGYVNVNTNAQATNDNHLQDVSLHEKPKRATNTPSVPNIMINGNSTDLSDKRVNGTDDEEESSSGKL
jgi:hypothetical protein